MRNHHNLRAFQLADELALEVYRVTREFPREEQFGLVTQMRRAAVSAASNIVEGSARNSDRDYIRFLDIAFGSLKEVEYQISLATRLEFISGDDSGKLTSVCNETSKVLNGLLRSLRRKQS